MENEIHTLEKMMAEKGGDYWEGPNAEKNQARYRELVQDREDDKWWDEFIGGMGGWSHEECMDFLQVFAEVISRPECSEELDEFCEHVGPLVP